MLLFTLAGCKPPQTTPAGPGASSGNQDHVRIMTTFYPIYIMTWNICQGIDGVQVFNLTKPDTGCLHDYQLTPGDLQFLADADILVVNGAGMESFMDKITSQYPNLKIVDASRGLRLIEENGEVNPHLWVSLSGAAAQTQNISDQLGTLDSAHAPRYQENAHNYIAKLRQLQTEMHQALYNTANRRVVTFHEAFAYFAQEFDLQVVAVLEREPGSEPSAGELGGIIETIQKSDVKAVFAEPQYPADSATVVGKESGVPVFNLDPAVDGPDDPDAYLQIMQRNAQVLKEALR